MAGRPRSFDRGAALRVAVEQFWRSGYEGTSVAMLTAAMGVTPPSLYAAFGDKHHLFEEASTWYFERTCEAVDHAAALPTAYEAIRQVLDDAARAHTDSATPPGCLLLTEPRLGPQREVIRQRLKSRLDQAQRDGDLDATADTERLASFLVAVMRGMSGCARDGGTAEEVSAIAEVAATALLKASRPSQAAPA
ncbi:TetR/AcrR family transcriptional regulator [Aeromicrobium wangtongii]|uniref:TetR/AcrR family transcriptional regulator n=1 Tax=Aeromicrobium wangtongii TaxID=2969247 RepID=A0ABY5M708_9ACTN|nr:TetR/AcrR family transcriptional regulator [Aeromicrobium wangtongii]MCD9199053.1 TetR/AcrR family transcriptional regulator [Aeromicrobium wangtongii]UUP12916.1 TetR/AcrR family transcriptional regulator [Aeromicrobium wangtongii]